MEKEKYDKIGVGYNNTRKADPYLTSRFIHHLNPKSWQKFLDIGCGTGNYTSAFLQMSLDFVGMDPSMYMLSKAKENFPNGNWMQGAAEKTGLASKSIDGITGSLTIHHWVDLEVAFKELHRILKPNGRLILFTSTPMQMKGYWLNAYFPKMLRDSIDQMPSLELITSALHKSGFQVLGSEEYFVLPELKDLFLYSGKHRPHLYLDAQVRQGISSFSDLSNIEEVRSGLARLTHDIKSNRIQQEIDRHKNNLGDYLFVTAQT